MSNRRIDALIWRALTDTTFRERLLNGQRLAVVAAADLTEVERQVVLAVQADTLEAFAGELCRPLAWA